MSPTDQDEFRRQSEHAAERAKRQRGHIDHARWIAGHLEFTIAPNRKAEHHDPEPPTSRRGIAQGRLL